MRAITGRKLLAGGLLSLGLLAGPLAGSAHAAYVTCKTDPVITLSNGKQVTLWAVVMTDASNISAVYYTLHVPVGTAVRSIQSDQYGSLEHVTILADSQRNQIHDDTKVTLKQGTTTVRVYMSDNVGNDTATAIGMTGQWLQVGRGY